MAEQDWGTSFAAATGSAMQMYQDTLVDDLFTPWGRSLVDALGVSSGESACDVACGPGTVTRLLAEAVGPGGSVAGCDISEGMLEVARAKGPVPGGPAIDYHQAPAERLPLDEGSVDVVACAQGLQFFPDKAAALREMRRVLRPGGRLGATVWTAMEQTPPFNAMLSAIREVLGDEVAAAYEAGPWGLPEPSAVESLLRDADFEEVEVEVRELPLVFRGGADQLFATFQFSAVQPHLEGLGDEGRAALRKRLGEMLAPLIDDGAVRSHARSTVARGTR